MSAGSGQIRWSIFLSLLFAVGIGLSSLILFDEETTLSSLHPTANEDGGHERQTGGPLLKAGPLEGEPRGDEGALVPGGGGRPPGASLSAMENRITALEERLKDLESGLSRPVAGSPHPVPSGDLACADALFGKGSFALAGHLYWAAWMSNPGHPETPRVLDAARQSFLCSLDYRLIKAQMEMLARCPDSETVSEMLMLARCHALFGEMDQAASSALEAAALSTDVEEGFAAWLEWAEYEGAKGPAAKLKAYGHLLKLAIDSGNTYQAEILGRNIEEQREVLQRS